MEIKDKTKINTRKKTQIKTHRRYTKTTRVLITRSLHRYSCTIVNSSIIFFQRLCALYLLRAVV